MLLLSSSYFGEFATEPLGLLLMACLLLIEIVVMSQVLARAYFTPRVAFAALASNVVSGIIGAYTSIALNGGRLLTVWFPWVSSREVNLLNDDELLNFGLYFAVAFVAAVLIELAVNYQLMKKHYEFRPILSATIIANVVSFVVGCFALYTYSFSLFE